MKFLRLLVFPILFLMGLTGTAHAKYNEDYFTKLIAKEYGFKLGPTRGAFQPDLFKDSYVVEVDWEHKMYEAIGQSLVYSIETGKKPAIIILDDVTKKINYSKFKKHFKKLGIKVWVAKVNKKNGKLHSFKGA